MYKVSLVPVKGADKKHEAYQWLQNGSALLSFFLGEKLDFTRNMGLC